MNARRTIILPLALLGLTACDVGNNHRVDDADTVHELFDSRPQVGRIAEIGEVDWYEFQPTQNSGSQIAIEVLSDTLRSDVELLVSIYQEQNGELERLYADHAPEGATTGTDLNLNYQLSSNVPVLISVRDLMDDEAANGDYKITVQEGMNDQGNDVLAGAETLNVDGDCLSGRIDSMGDVDLFKFSLGNAAITQVAATLNSPGDSSLELNLSLYGSDTLLIDSWSQSSDGYYGLRQYLEAGDYTLAIEDFGRDDFDLSAPYSTCVTQIPNQEAMLNDDANTAEPYDLASGNPAISGSIGHQTDQDWYVLSLPAPGANDLQLLEVTLDANASGEDLQYEIRDVNNDVIFSYIHRGGSSTYSQQVLVGDGDHTLTVTLAEGDQLQDASDYTVTLVVSEVNDAGETGTANNDISNAITLTDSAPATGKIAYRGDIDWYVLELNPHATDYQVLELGLSSSDESNVAYRMQVVLDEVIAAVDDPMATDNILDVQSALLVTPRNDGDLNGVRRYFVKISDAYAEKSDSFATYNLVATVRDLQSFDNALLPAAVDGSKLVFVDENDEQLRLVNETNLAQLELNGYKRQSFAVEKDTMQFRDPLNAFNLVQRTDNGDGTISIDLPWLGGYIDYSGDQDWYALDLKGLGTLVDGITEYPIEDSDWHYLVQIDLVNAAGESSEYQWRFYRDERQNQVVRDRPTTDGDGYLAQQGDDTLTTGAVSLTTAGMMEDDKPAFWVSDDWDETFYLAVSDFDFRRDPTTTEINPKTDDDWSQAASPYFVRVKLIYVAGEHRP